MTSLWQIGDGASPPDPELRFLAIWLALTAPMNDAPMKRVAYVSLVQYMPNLFRRECVNVGVVVYCPDDGSFALRFTDNNDRPRRLFPNIDDQRLTLAKKGIANRLRYELRSKSFDALHTFRKREGNSLQLTEPITTKIDRSIEEDADEFFELLVEKPTDGSG